MWQYYYLTKFAPKDKNVTPEGYYTRTGPTVNQNGSSYASGIHDQLDIEITLKTFNSGIRNSKKSEHN
jgi:hypothetical protein